MVFMRWLFLSVLLTASASAQPVAVDSSCSFTACALRIESGVFSSHVVRGPIGAEQTVSRLGFFGGGVADAVADSPAALAYAERSQAHYRNGLLMSLAASVLYVVALTPDGSVSDGVRIGATLTALGLGVGSGLVLSDAHRSRERAIWEYNRSFAE